MIINIGRPENKDNSPDPRKALSKLEYETYRSEFKKRFKLKSGEELNESFDNCYVLWSDILLAAERTEQVPGVGGRGVMVHFGIEDSELRYGFSFFPWRESTPTGWLFDPIEFPQFVVEQKRLRPGDDFPWITWKGDYYRNVSALHDTTVDDLDQQRDPCSVVMPWESELRELYLQNIKAIGSNLSPHLRVSSVSTLHSDADGGCAGYRHGLALNVATKSGATWTNLVQNGDNVSIYNLRALDYGNLCPVRCSYYER